MAKKKPAKRKTKAKAASKAPNPTISLEEIGASVLDAAAEAIEVPLPDAPFAPQELNPEDVISREAAEPVDEGHAPLAKAISLADTADRIAQEHEDDEIEEEVAEKMAAYNDPLPNMDGPDFTLGEKEAAPEEPQEDTQPEEAPNQPAPKPLKTTTVVATDDGIMAAGIPEAPLTEMDLKADRWKRRVKGRLRKKRIPLSGNDVLKISSAHDKRFEGMRTRFVEDDGSRVEQFIDAGWKPVEGDIDTGGGQIGDFSLPGSIVTRGVGNNDINVLMEIPEELYMKDQRAKWRELDETEALMNRDSKTPDASGLYGSLSTRRG